MPTRVTLTGEIPDARVVSDVVSPGAVRLKSVVDLAPAADGATTLTETIETRSPALLRGFVVKQASPRCRRLDSLSWPAASVVKSDTSGGHGCPVSSSVEPAGGARPDAPVVIGYHLLDPPRTEVALAAALPLDGLDAWRIYLGLPMSGARAQDLWPLLAEDAVRNVYEPVAFGALEEFPEAYGKIRDRLGIADDVPLGVLGGSLGGAVAQLVAATHEVRAAVLVNPVVRLRDAIDGISAHHGTPYTWSGAADRVAERVDFVARAGELEATAIRYITGADDMAGAIIEPVEAVVAELARRGAVVDHHVVREMGHALAEEPGTEAAPQTPHARETDRLAVEWFREHL